MQFSQWATEGSINFTLADLNWKFEFSLSLEKAMATHSSTLAWKILWTEEPGRLQSMGLLRVGQDWVTSLSLFTFMHWRRKWQSTPVFLPGESQGQGCLVGCCLWGHTESNTTEVTQQQQQLRNFLFVFHILFQSQSNLTLWDSAFYFYGH